MKTDEIIRERTLPGGETVRIVKLGDPLQRGKYKVVLVAGSQPLVMTYESLLAAIDVYHTIEARK